VLRALRRAVAVGQAHDDERTADLARTEIRDLGGAVSGEGASPRSDATEGGAGAPR
jgi:hypothetical protein